LHVGNGSLIRHLHFAIPSFYRIQNPSVNSPLGFSRIFHFDGLANGKTKTLRGENSAWSSCQRKYPGVVVSAPITAARSSQADVTTGSSVTPRQFFTFLLDCLDRVGAPA
jgi:hypothetical protein